MRALDFLIGRNSAVAGLPWLAKAVNGTQFALDWPIGHRLGRDPKLVFCTVGESVVN